MEDPLTASTKVELILLLDAYDELPSGVQFKNLYRTNNLERYQPKKIIITARSEMFSAYKDIRKYHKCFYPIDPKNKDRDEDKEGEALFVEKVWLIKHYIFSS